MNIPGLTLMTAWAAIALVIGGAAAQAPPPAAAPAQRPASASPPTAEELFPPIPARALAGLPAYQRNHILALRDACMAGYRETVAEARQAKLRPRLEAMTRLPTRERQWVGLLTERDIGRSTVSFEIAVAPGITIGTASQGWLIQDPADTRPPVGSTLHRRILDIPRNTPVAFEFQPVSIYVSQSGCSVTARIQDVMTGR